MSVRHVGRLYLPERGATIRWHAVGDGPALVFLPGLSMPAVTNFLGAATHPALAGRRVLMVDYLGSGLSDCCPDHDGTPEAHAGDVAAVLDHLGLSGVDLFGHSMGGTVGIALALARPDLVARLGVGEGNLVPGGGMATRSIASQPLAAWMAAGYDAMMAGLRARAVSGEAHADRLYSGWMQADARTLWANSKALVELRDGFREDFLALGLPRSFFFGEKNVPQDAGEATPDTPDPVGLRAHGVDVQIVPAAGHGMHFDNPEAFAALVAAIFPK